MGNTLMQENDNYSSVADVNATGISTHLSYTHVKLSTRIFSRGLGLSSETTGGLDRPVSAQTITCLPLWRGVGNFLCVLVPVWAKIGWGSTFSDISCTQLLPKTK